MTQAPRWLVAAGLLLALMVLLGPGAARAQETAPAPVEPSDIERILPEEVAPEGVESIQVVGEKLNVTDVQDEAQAISSFSMDDLDKLNISSVDGLAANVPGLHVGQVGQSAVITLRGIGTENASVTGESGVAFHVDGIYYGRPSAARVAFFDLEKLDVSRGPQGLLGGKNSTSGSINVVTRDPSDDYEVEGDILLGNYDRLRARGVVNVPLGEYAAFRTAFFHEDRDGYLDNGLFSDSRDPFDADSFGLRTKLRLSPTDSLTLVATYNYFQEKGNGPQADLVPILNTNACTRPAGVVTVMPRGVVCQFGRIGPGGIWDPDAVEDADPRRIWTDNASGQDNKYWGMHGKVLWDAPEMPLLGLTTLELRGGYQRTENSFDWDFDGSSVRISDIQSSNFAHEYSADVRWMGTAIDERLSWQTSLFFMRERGGATRFSPRFETDAFGNTADVIIRTDQATENKSYGAALHGELVLTEALTVSLGGRWTKDRKESALSRIASGELETCDGALGRILDPSTGQSIFPSAPACSAVFRGTTWGSRLEWRPQFASGFFDDQLIYAGIDRGFKSGGFGLGGIGSYLPEKIWAYSLGAKSEFWDRRIQINIEGFFYAYEDMQVALIDGLQIRTENADTRMYGWELEAKTQPIAGLTLRAVVGQLRTEVRDYATLDPAKTDVRQESRLNSRRQAELNGLPFTDLDDFAGNQLSRAPEWKYTLSAEYEIPLGDLGFLTPRVQYSFQDDTYHRVFNRSFDLQGDHHLTDVKLVWRSLEGRWEAEVFVQNVEDEAVKEYILIGPSFIDSPPLAWYNEPRFYGFRIGFRY